MKYIDRNKLLPWVEKPGRYMGGELNSVLKDPARVKVWIVLSYPDLYEIGMSNLGLQILYETLNSLPSIACERVFSPGVDMESLLRKGNIPLFSLESGLSIRSFDILGISLGHELCYTNVLNLLDLSHIPLHAEERGQEDPIVIGGGPATSNPEPLVPFFDCFFIGEAEEGIVEIARIVLKARQEGQSRAGIIASLGDIAGIYLPDKYKISYKSDGTIKSITGPRVVRRLSADFVHSSSPQQPIVPYIRTTQDKATIEVTRGCSRGCRFCQAGFIYRPPRDRAIESLVRDAEKIIDSTGYEEVSLLSLSIADYAPLPQLVALLNKKLVARGVNISLPSLRIDSFTLSIAKSIQSVRKSGLTFALESGESAIRNRLNKPIKEKQLYEIIQKVFAQGWDLVKIYFMIGLSSAEDEASGIIKVLKELDKLARCEGGRKRVNVTISVYVPKPHTPFQWLSQAPLDKMEETIKKIRSLQPLVAQPKVAWHSKRITLKFHSPFRAMIEGVFSRGDRRVADLLFAAWKLGSRFDNWREYFKPDLWLKAFTDTGVDPDFYTTRQRTVEEILPWSHVHCGVSPRFLITEFERGQNGILTADCRECSHSCGACSGKPPLIAQGPSTDSADFLSADYADFRGLKDSRTKIRFKFTKLGNLRWIGHLDLVDILKRALRRSRIPVAYSAGFNPSMRLSLSPPLSLGIESRAEYGDIELTSPMEPIAFMDRLNSYLPEGIKLVSARTLSGKSPSLQSQIHASKYSIGRNQGIDYRTILDRWPQRKDFLVTIKKKDKRISVDLKKSLLKAGEEDKGVADTACLRRGRDRTDSGRIPRIKKGVLWFILTQGERDSIGPGDFLKVLFNLSPAQVTLLQIQRLEQYSISDGNLIPILP